MTARKESLPQIIQGGMGIGVSDHRLARAVALAGGLGVVSGTAIDTVMVRRLGLGDPGGEIRRALASFPFPGVAERILRAYFVPGGKAARAPFRLLPLPNLTMSRQRLALIVAANYVEVALAKEGHDAPIGVNYLEKIQAPTLASLLGAVLAGVDVVLVGDSPPHVGYGELSAKLAERARIEADLTTHTIQAKDKQVKHFPEIAEFGGGRCVLLKDTDAIVPEIAGLSLSDRFQDEFAEFFRVYLQLCR